MKFACRCDFNVQQLAGLCEDNITFLSNAADIALYRNHVGHLLNALYVSSLRCETEGIIYFFTSHNRYSFFVLQMITSDTDDVRMTEELLTTTAVIEEAVKVKEPSKPKKRKRPISPPELVATPIGAGKCYVQELNYA